MGNQCFWCFKKSNTLLLSSDVNDFDSSSSPVPTDRTPLLQKSLSNHLVIPYESSELCNNSKPIMSDENPETTMNSIVDEILPKLIDVGRNLPHPYSNKLNQFQTNHHDDSLRQSLQQSFLNKSKYSFPDVGMINVPSLMSDRPISAELHHFISQTAEELCHLLIDDIKIIHKENLVVLFD